MTYENRWYQDEALASIFNFFNSHKEGNPVVALPTGTGKGVVISQFIEYVQKTWPDQRIMMLTHVKELIEQNAEKLLDIWPTASPGIHSAGLKRRDMASPLIFGGVQSVAPAIKRENKKPAPTIGLPHFGHRDLVLIDEAHLIPPKQDAQYTYVFDELRALNPHIRFIGFTATNYRMKQGLLTDPGGLFTHTCYDLTDFEGINRLVYEGYLSPLLPRPTKEKLDLSGVRIVGGEYVGSQIEAEMDETKLFKAVKEMVYFGEDRQAWICFCQGVKQTELLTEMLLHLGVNAACVHSKKKETDNNNILKAQKRGEIRCVVNANKLTTGYDYPPIDLIGMFRATLSPGLWVQMLGRGTRPSPQTGKQNCLVLDFARNTERLGPFNDPVIPRRPGARKSGQDAPVKLCGQCGFYNHTSAPVCVACGAEFPRVEKIRTEASTQALMRDNAPIVKQFKVDKVIYNRHEKRNPATGNLVSPPMIKVIYICGLRQFHEYIMLEHSGWGAKRARDWWRQRHSEEPPATTNDALKMVSQLRAPRAIDVDVNKKYPEVLGAEW